MGQVSDVVLSCCIVKGVAPKGDVQICFGHSKSDVINVFCIFDVASLVSYGEKTDFLCISSFIPGIFPPRTCTWSAVIGRNP